ncbi:MAG: FHA domain-containing protein [Anaerolineae bacterium]|nr:FHA domain-containing protein [Anaerolineae bacterium]
MGELLLALRLILTILLYLFLGVAFYILWRGLRQNEQQPDVRPTPAKLTVEEGVSAGMSITLRPVTTAGRADNNPMILDDPFASTHHAMFLWRENAWWLEDLESHNGTFLNGERIFKPTQLTSGDHIRIGQTILRFDAFDEVTSVTPTTALKDEIVK